MAQPHPGSSTLWEYTEHAPADNRVDLTAFTERPGHEPRSLSLWWVTKSEWDGLLDVSGLETEALYRSFDRQPFDDDATEFVWIAGSRRSRLGPWTSTGTRPRRTCRSGCGGSAGGRLGARRGHRAVARLESGREERSPARRPRARLDVPLEGGPGTIVSTLQNVDPPREIAWTGRTMGISAEHVYRLEPRGNGTHVVSEESWAGLPVRLLRARMAKTLQTSLEEGLAHLKAAAERSSP